MAGEINVAGRIQTFFVQNHFYFPLQKQCVVENGRAVTFSFQSFFNGYNVYTVSHLNISSSFV